jgi:sphingolipid delta-4 desaturase
MGAAQADHEFTWVTDAEPHATRRKAILAKYGKQVRELYGYDNWTAVQVIAVSLFQVLMAWVVKDMAWWKVMLASYAIAGTASQNLFTAQHELSHFLAFRKPLYNRILSIASNCPVVIPMATSFRKYHQEHHSHLGVDGWDVDLPTSLEANYVTNVLAKIMWVFSYIAVYGIRPLIIRPKAMGVADLVNIAAVVVFDVAVLYFWGLKSLAYMFCGNILGGGIHPMAGHLIAEHYTFAKGQETYSYYGPLNKLTYNVGYHNEHHDFPQIPHSRLYRLREIAPEYYNDLAFHTSWTWIIWKFLSDPEVGPWTRTKRETREDPAVVKSDPAAAVASPVPGAFADVTNMSSPGIRTRSATKKLASSPLGTQLVSVH